MAGFDIALAGYIADYLGLKLEVVPVDFDGVSICSKGIPYRDP